MSIYVIIPKEKEKPTPEMLFAQTGMKVKEINLEQVEKQLSDLVAMFTKIERMEAKYSVDEAKLSIGVAQDDQGNIKAGISTNILSFFKGEINAEAVEKLSGNNLIELTIKRKS
jgi:hypothetical protein